MLMTYVIYVCLLFVKYTLGKNQGFSTMFIRLLHRGNVRLYIADANVQCTTYSDA